MNLLIYAAIALAISASTAFAVWPIAKMQGVASQQKIVNKANEDRDDARKIAEDTRTEYNKYRAAQAEMLAKAEIAATKARDEAKNAERKFRTSVDGIVTKYESLLSERKEVTCTLTSSAVDTINSVILETNK